MDEVTTTHELAKDKPPTTRERLFAILKFLLFAVAVSLFLIGLKAAISKIPTTASLLRQAEAGTGTASLILIIDGIGLIAVIGLCALAAKIERRPFGAFGLPPRDAFRKRFMQGLLWGMILAFLDVGCTYLLGGFSFGTLALAPGKIVGYAVIWALAFLMVGLFEEFLYRGYALYNLAIGVGDEPKMFVSRNGLQNLSLGPDENAPIGCRRA